MHVAEQNQCSLQERSHLSLPKEQEDNLNRDEVAFQRVEP